MEVKRCKNKKCQRPLPENYKHKLCEHCRSKQAQTVKNAGQVAGAVGMLALAVITRGKVPLPKKK